MMYSPVVVAGSNTHNFKMPNKKSNKTAIKNHMFKGVREVILSTTTGSVVYPVTTSSAGVANGGLILSAYGLNTVSLSGSIFTASQLDPPHLRWLTNQASNFGSYRVTRAKLVFVGNIGSTSSGTINLQGFKDTSDAGFALSTAFVGGNFGRVFDLASSATRELSIPLPVDSSWKRVTSTLAEPGNIFPFTGGVASFTVQNTVNDLSFVGFSYQVTGGPASTSVGTFMLDYDVEFSEPQNSSINI